MRILSGMEIRRRWGAVCNFLDPAVIPGIVAFTALLIAANFYVAVLEVRSRASGSLESRIEQLSESLADAAQIISAIESEVDARQELVARLQEQRVVAEAAAELNQEQVDAIAQILGNEVDRSSRQTFIRAVVLNIVFFVLGVGAAEGFHRRRSRVRPG